MDAEAFIERSDGPSEDEVMKEFFVTWPTWLRIVRPRGIERRLLRALALVGGPNGIRATQHQLARLLCCCREQISRALPGMVARGVVVRRGKLLALGDKFTVEML